MDKTSKKVTKDPKCVDAARKGREKYMNKLKKTILNDARKGDGDTTNASNETTSANNTATTPATSTSNTTTTTRSNDTYVYSLGILTVLATGVCVFFIFFLHIRLKIKNKTMIAWRLSMSKKSKINHQSDVICFRKNIQ